MTKALLFASDLDNTLLRSRKRSDPGDRCVEWIHEKEQGFMTPETLRLLPAVGGRTRFVPVTTRSTEQYLRIRFPAGSAPEYAAVTNGAVLLRRGEPDPAWAEAMRGVIDPCRRELAEMERVLNGRKEFIRCRTVDDAYLFVYCAEGINVRETETRLREKTSLRVQASGKKIYLLPPALCKAGALRMLRDRFRPRRTVCAGDSPMDADMLSGADLAICPAELRPLVSAAETAYWGGEGSFAEFVLNRVLAEAESLL